MIVVDRKHFPGLATLYLAQLGDSPERLAEFVDTREPGVPVSEKWVMMISTQFGCPVGCRMCDAGAMPYLGNLSAEEILSQVRRVVAENPFQDIARHPKVKIHFARMGEPSLNPAVLKALRLLAREYPSRGIMPSLSTVAPKSPAVEPFFKELLEIKNELYGGGRFQLQFSLHSLDEDKRREIVPIKKWSLEEVAAYGEEFFRPGDRKVTLNFAPAAGEVLDCGKLSALFSPEKFFIKVTPINPTATADRTGITNAWVDAPEPIRDCAERLRSMGFEALLSPSLPEEIQAETSCGQLWSGALKERAARMVKNRRREAESYVRADTLAARAEAWKKEIEKFRRRTLSLRREKAGLLVVDMQELFLSPQSPAYLPSARAILGTVVRLIEAFREAGRPVCFSVHAHQDPDQDGGLMGAWWKTVCRAGSPEAALPEFFKAETGRIFSKCRYSAFSAPGLERALSEDGVQDLVVAGAATNLCVESTVRHGFDLGIRMTAVLDACAAHSDELHLGSLKNMAWGFASVCDAEQVLRALRGGGGGRAAPAAHEISGRAS